MGKKISIQAVKTLNRSAKDSQKKKTLRYIKRLIRKKYLSVTFKETQNGEREEGETITSSLLSRLFLLLEDNVVLVQRLADLLLDILTFLFCK